MLYINVPVQPHSTPPTYYTIVLYIIIYIVIFIEYVYKH